MAFGQEKSILYIEVVLISGIIIIERFHCTRIIIYEDMKMTSCEKNVCYSGNTRNSC